MNKMQDRAYCINGAPPTPNLEQYKQQGRNKIKKKNISPTIQPTQQPIQYTNLHNILQKSPTTPTNAFKLTFCQNHPDKKATFITKDAKPKQYCTACVVTDGADESKYLDEEKYEKTKSIQSFKRRANILKEYILDQQDQINKIVSEQQTKYGQYFSYISASFKTLIDDIEQKHHELNNLLIESIQKRKQSMQWTMQFMGNIKESIERYIFDINKNYEQILADLAVQQFRDIMKQYNTKVDYYTDNLKKVSKDQTSLSDLINVYLPIQQLRRVIDKANVQYFGVDPQRIGLVSNKSVQKFNSCGNDRQDRDGKISRYEKHQRYDSKYQRHDRQDKNDRKSESKAPKKRNVTNGHINYIRGANKENNFLDSYYNQRGGYRND